MDAEWDFEYEYDHEYRQSFSLLMQARGVGRRLVEESMSEYTYVEEPLLVQLSNLGWEVID